MSTNYQAPSDIALPGHGAAAPDADPVNQPAHYNFAPNYQALDVIEAWAPSWDSAIAFNLGNVIKYSLRHNLKGEPVEDLEKAVVYLTRAVAILRGGDPGAAR